MRPFHFVTSLFIIAVLRIAVDPGEGRSKSVEDIIRRLTSGVTHGEILLLHETYYKIRNVPLEQIIKGVNSGTRDLQRQGFSFVRLDPLLARGIQPVVISKNTRRQIETNCLSGISPVADSRRS